MMKQSGEAYRNIRLCVDTYDCGAMTGQFYFSRLETEGSPFSSLVQFLTEAEQELDRVGFPQSYTARRSFAAAPPESVDPVAREAAGKAGTFDIRLLFRQHASWQGTVRWAEGGSEMSFRSVLELILLINSALAGEG